MLTFEESTYLIKQLSDYENSLNTIFARMKQDCDDFERFLRGIRFLLSNLCLGHRQQIISWWILYKSSDLKIMNHPYYSVFHNIVTLSRPNETSPILRSEVSKALSGKDMKYLGAMNVVEIEKSYSVNHALCTSISDISVPMIISCPTANKEPIEFNEMILDMLTGFPYTECFEIPYFRPSPNIYPITEDEISHNISLSSAQIPFFFDTNSSNSDIKSLFKKAFQKKIEESDVNLLLSVLRDSPQLLPKSHAKNYYALCETNPSFGFPYMLNLASQTSEIFQTLETFPITRVSVDLITYLDVYVPNEFYNKWIMSTMNSMKNTTDLNTTMKAMLFCRFITYLIQKGKDINNDVKLDIKAFCFDLFSTKGAQDAKALYQLL